MSSPSADSRAPACGEIGERAGLEFTLIKYHFRSKDALWRAVAESAFEQIGALWDEAIPGDSQMSAAERVKTSSAPFCTSRSSTPPSTISCCGKIRARVRVSPGWSTNS